LIVILTFLSSNAFAGGFPVHVKIEAMEYKGNNEFKMVLSHVDGRLPSGIKENQPIIFHLRLKRIWNKKITHLSSRERYTKCINTLLTYFQKNEPFYFSTTINEPIEGKVNEFQSNGLRLMYGIDRNKMDTVTAHKHH